MDLTLINSTLAPPSRLVENFPLNSTFGAALIGAYLSLILLGGIIHQTFRYYQTYPNDNVWIKCLVALVVSAEVVHTGISIQACYYFLVTGYSNLSTLEHIPLSFHALTVLSSVIIVLSQVFLVRRAYVFGKKYRRWAVLVAILLLGEFVFSLASSIDNIVKPPTTGLISHLWMISVAAALAVAADGILTTILTVSLRQSRNGIKRTDALIDILILYSMATGSLTAVCMLVLFAFAITHPNDMIYVAISFVVTKLYTNSLLAALNTRKSLRETVSNPFGVEIFGTTGGTLPLEQGSLGVPDLHSDNTVSLELSDMRIRNEKKACT